MPFVKQLMGEGRHYISDGIHGRGTYTAFRSDRKEGTDELASSVAWTYGLNEGSMQVQLCFNEKAKIVNEEEILKKVQEFSEIFPKLHKKIKESEFSFRTNPYSACLSIFAALYGYNTIKIPESGFSNQLDPVTKEDVIIYAVTFDRSAFTMLNEATRRKKEAMSRYILKPVKGRAAQKVMLS